MNAALSPLAKREMMSSVPGHIEIQSWYTIIAVNAVKKKKCISGRPCNW